MSPEEKKAYLAHRQEGYAQRRIMDKRLLEENKKLKKQQKEIEEEERRLAELKRKLEEQEDQQQKILTTQIHVGADPRGRGGGALNPLLLLALSQKGGGSKPTPAMTPPT